METQPSKSYGFWSGVKDIGPVVVAVLAIIVGFLTSSQDRSERLAEMDKENTLQVQTQARTQQVDVLKRLLLACDSCARECDGLPSLKGQLFHESLTRLYADIQTLESVGVEARLFLEKDLADQISATWQSIVNESNDAQQVDEGAADIASKLSGDDAKFNSQYEALKTSAHNFAVAGSGS